MGLADNHRLSLHEKERAPSPLVTDALFSRLQRVRRLRQLPKTLRATIALRLLGICVLGCLTGYLIFDTPYWMAGMWTALATAMLFYETVRFVSHSERKLAAFLQTLQQDDFSVTFPENLNSAHYDLHFAFNQLSAIFKTLRSEKEAEHQFLHIIVETAAVPMICFDDASGDVYMVNNAAKELFRLPFLRNISALRKVDETLPQLLVSIPDGDKETLKVTLAGKTSVLSTTCSHVIFSERNLKLVAFHDVSSALAVKEADTWQKLLRVLTHEISNSAIPLSTLSSYICEVVAKAEAENRALTPDERRDVLISLKTIEQRSKSVRDFVNSFKAVNEIPEPKIEKLSLRELVGEVMSLFSRECQVSGIQMRNDISDGMFVYADRNLSAQVLVNVTKNAVEAMENLKSNKLISVDAARTGRYCNVNVRDSGTGISPDDMDQIFIPFYSTKKGGSGIGLSISRQIMQKQKGDIAAYSVAGKGSVFVLSFCC